MTDSSSRRIILSGIFNNLFTNEEIEKDTLF